MQPVSGVPAPVDEADTDPLADASREELIAAVRLLAASLVKQREAPDSDPFLRAKKQLEREDGASARLIERYVRYTLQRAMNVVRVDLAAFSAPTQAGTDAAGSIEQRRQYRINLSSSVTLLSPRDERTVKATLCNISWGGAAVTSQDSFAERNDRVWLVLPADKESGIPVLSTVVRAETVGEMTEYGLRFDSMRPEDAQRFRRVLEILTAEPHADGQRAAPRLVQRLDVAYDDSSELRASLEDISSGGLMLTLPDPMELHQSILIALSSVDGSVTLELRARVVHVALVREGGAQMYRVGLKFEHPEAELEERVENLLQEVLAQDQKQSA